MMNEEKDLNDYRSVKVFYNSMKNHAFLILATASFWNIWRTNSVQSRDGVSGKRDNLEVKRKVS